MEVVETPSLESESVPRAVPRYDEIRRKQLPRLLPFLPEPGYRKFAANVPGDSGFDPLGFCTDVAKFVQYREAELKHGRLAMIAAVAWPAAEIAEPIASEELGLPDVLAESGGRALPQLNFEGGLGDQFVETFIALVVLFGAAVELSAPQKGRAPGDYGFDPLNLAKWSPPWATSVLPGKRGWMRQAEITHARVAMMVLLFFTVDELVTGNPVVEDTEYTFHVLDARIFRMDYWTSAPETLESLDIL